MNSDIDEFLDKFQTLEKLIKNYPGARDETNFKDALLLTSKTNGFIKENFSLIEDLNSLRNVFSHRNRGRYIAKINNFVIKNLDKIISDLKNPPTVISKFGVDVFQTTQYKEINKVMEVMHDKTYTHVPVWKDNYLDNNNEFIGVFSYTSFFEWLADRQEKEDIPTFTKRFFKDVNPKYINSPVVNFEFIPENKSVFEIPSIFNKYTQDKKRLDCLLLTQNGKKGEKISGIITSWDLGSI